MIKQTTSDGLHPTMKAANKVTFMKQFKGKMKPVASGRAKGTDSVKR